MEKMPPAQALIYVLQKALLSMQLIKSLEAEWNGAVANGKDASSIRQHQSIIIDAFTIYVSSLVDKTKGVHSLLKSYETNPFIEQFNADALVKECVEHRNNRAGHQSQFYGSVIKLESILQSDLESALSGLIFLVRQFEEKKIK